MSKEVIPVSATDSPLAAFRGAIVPTRTGPLYHAGLAIVAFAMVLLPIIYLTLIGLAGLAVFYHLKHDTWILEGASGRGSVFQMIVYLGPAVAGVILIFFMIKPFFAARAKAPDPVTLDPEHEPLLFAFVKKICDLVGAPTPGRVDVDCQVNASASLRRGVLSRDLVLTIGLPLAAGLDTRQFAGVLAHEFGHFAQGAGMRLTYVIRHISAWFARVVYERDAWDVRLEQSASGTAWQIALILHAARGCVWVTRRILWALMHVGHAISCFMLRQMEYDADSYEAKLAGSDAYETTAHRLRLLNVGTQFAYEDVRQNWASRRLPENLLLLIEHKTASLPAEIQQKISAATAEEKTGWFHTHPCDSDRIHAVRRLNEPGVFHLAEPTARLFSDFTSLCKTVTRHQYEKHFELQFTEQNLMSAEEILRESAASTEADAMVRRYYGTVNITWHPLFIDRQLPQPANAAEAMAQWQIARAESEARREEAQKTSAACGDQIQRRASLMSVQRLAAASFQVKPEAFGLPDHATSPGELETAAKSALEETATTMNDHLVQMEPFVAALRQRIGLALALNVNGAGISSPGMAEEIAALVPLLTAVGAEMQRAHAMASSLRAFTVLAQNRDNHSDPSQVDNQVLALVTDLQAHVTGIQERLTGFTYPFAHARGQLTVAEYLQADQPAEHEWQRAYEAGTAHVDRLFALNYRLVGRVLALAESAEKALEKSGDQPATGFPEQVGRRQSDSGVQDVT